LAVRTTLEDELQAFHLPTSTLQDRLAARVRLDDAIAQIDGVRLVGPSDRGNAISSQDVFGPALHLESFGPPASHEARRAWLRRVLGSLDAAARADQREPPHVPNDALGGYELSVGTLRPVPWTTVFAYDPDWLTALWDAGGFTCILIRSLEAAPILGVRLVGATAEAFLCPNGTVRTAGRST
jgi:hypothetical protein